MVQEFRYNINIDEVNQQKMISRPVALRIAFIIVFGYALTNATKKKTPLDDYVKAPDSHYKYEYISTITQDEFTVYVLNMTSQKWLDEKFTNHPIWWHYVSIVVPKQVTFNDTAMLFIGQGHNTYKPPDLWDFWLELMTNVAVKSNSIVVFISQVPNEPISFNSDPLHGNRSEDSIVAWSWREFILNTTRPESMVLLPMTKAAVRAMDTADDFSKKRWNQTINKFFVVGASKRGWTTWLTSAVDKRVIGMAPIVFDLLNFEKALHHHYRSLGGWTFAFKAYVKANDTMALDSKNISTTLQTIDPFVYRDRYNMPIFIVKASGDEFFMLDETRFFFKQLQGPNNYLRVLPNCEHELLNKLPTAMSSIISFYQHLLHGEAYPRMKWVMTNTNSSGSIHLSMNRKPLTVKTYMARTLDGHRRDFRLVVENPSGTGKMLHFVFWFKIQTTKINDTEYKATVEKPPKGWAAFFIEAKFQGVGDNVLTFSTEVNVVPDTLPFPDCRLQGCRGVLV